MLLDVSRLRENFLVRFSGGGVKSGGAPSRSVCERCVTGASSSYIRQPAADPGEIARGAFQPRLDDLYLPADAALAVDYPATPLGAHSRPEADAPGAMTL